MHDQDNFYAAPQAELGTDRPDPTDGTALASAPQSFGETFGAVFRLFVDAFGPLFVIAVIYGLISGGSDFLTEISIQRMLLDTDEMVLMWGGVLFLSMVLPGIAWVYLWIVGIKRVHNIYTGQPVGDEWSHGVSRFFPLLGLTIVMMMAVSFGFVLCIIPGIILLFMLFVGDISVILEERGPIEGLQRSWELVKGVENWFYVFGLVFVVAMIVMIPAAFVGGIIGFVTLGDPLMTNTVSAVVTMITFPLFLSLNYLIFQGLIARQQWTDDYAGYGEYEDYPDYGNSQMGQAGVDGSRGDSW